MIESLSNNKLLANVRSLVKNERRISREVLEYLVEAESRRLYAELGFSSMFDWLVKDLGYSESAAYRRLQSARLVRAVPSALAKVESGELNLTTLAQAQTAIRHEERRTGQSVQPEEKRKIVAQIESLSSRETEIQLAKTFPAVLPQAERVRFVGEESVRIEITLTRDQYKKLERAREVMSHSHFGASLGEIVAVTVADFLMRKDPIEKEGKKQKGTGAPRSDTGAEVASYKGQFSPASKLAAQRFDSGGMNKESGSAFKSPSDKTGGRTPRKSLPSKLRQAVVKHARARCQFRDPISGQVCGSRFQIQIDHVRPYSTGGDNSIENLRVLCRTHNLLAAAHTLGAQYTRPYLKYL